MAHRVTFCEWRSGRATPAVPPPAVLPKELLRAAALAAEALRAMDGGAPCPLVEGGAVALGASHDLLSRHIAQQERGMHEQVRLCRTRRR
jgi:hypothetical protein